VKKFNKLGQIILVTLVVISIVISIWKIYFYQIEPQYYPEVHVCLQTCNQTASEMHSPHIGHWHDAPKSLVKHCGIEVPKGEHDVTIPKLFKSKYYYLAETNVCWNWREKTFCQLCSEDWSYFEMEIYYEGGMWSITPTGKRQKICEDYCICNEWDKKYTDYRKRHLQDLCTPCNVSTCLSCIEKPKVWLDVRNNSYNYVVRLQGCCNYWYHSIGRCLNVSEVN